MQCIVAGVIVVKVGRYSPLVTFILAVLGPDRNMVFRQKDPYSFLQVQFFQVLFGDLKLTGTVHNNELVNCFFCFFTRSGNRASAYGFQAGPAIADSHERW